MSNYCARLYQSTRDKSRFYGLSIQSAEPTGADCGRPGWSLPTTGAASNSAGLVFRRISTDDLGIPDDVLESYSEIRDWRDRNHRLEEFLGLRSGGRPAPEIVVDIMKEDVVIKRRTPEMSHSGGGKRGLVTSLSRASRQRMMLKARNISGLLYMLTLTYPAEYPRDGELVKYHFRLLREWLQRQGFSYGFWFLEFQKRGAPHYHIFLPHVEGTFNSDWKVKLSRRWAEIVGSRDFERHLRAGTRFELLRAKNGAARYASKYAGKMEQKEVPSDYENVGRFWGVWGRPVTVIKQISGVVPDVVDLVRFVRRAYVAVRRRWDNSRKWRDRGRRGFVAWGVGSLVGGAMEWASKEPVTLSPVHYAINARANC